MRHMHRWLITGLFFLMSAGAFSCDAPPPKNVVQAGSCTLEVLFSPKGGCTEAIVKEIGEAKSTLDIQAYSFTSAPIASAVSAAHQRGVAVRVILDDSQETAQYSSATFLTNHNVPVFMDSKHAIAHNKVMLIDQRVIITGSFNFTKAAEESNAENLLIIRDNPELMKKYQENFDLHLAHSKAKLQ